MYKSTHSFDERKNECEKLSVNYPDRICVIVAPAHNEKILEPLFKSKFAKYAPSCPVIPVINAIFRFNS